jgi:hypothetical protein
MEGANSRIHEASSSTVIKRSKRRAHGLDAAQQKEIHRLVLNILANPFYTILRAPYLVDGPFYEMEKIDTDTPLFLAESGGSERLLEELTRFWKALWALGYAAWDFELYHQPNGSVMMIDFDKFKKTGRLEPGFFVHPSFPRNFEKLLGAL